MPALPEPTTTAREGVPVSPDDERPVDWTRTTGNLLLSHVPEGLREQAAGFLAVYREDVRAAAIREAADALLKVDPVEWALAGQHAGNDAAKLLHALAAAPTTTTPEEH